MSKKRFVARKRFPTPSQLNASHMAFRVAVKKAEAMVIAITREKEDTLSPAEAMTLLALYTIATIEQTDTINVTVERIQSIIFRILGDPTYTPGAKFPYTKRQLLEAGVCDE